jgi:hypothetical protein
MKFFLKKGYWMLCCWLAVWAPAAAQAPFSLWQEPLPPLDSLGAEPLQSLTAELQDLHRQLFDTCDLRARRSAAALAVAETALLDARADTTAAKTTLDSLTRVYKTAQKADKEAQKWRNQALQAQGKADALLTLEPAEWRKQLLRRRKEALRLRDQVLPPAPQPAELVEKAPELPAPADTTASPAAPVKPVGPKVKTPADYKKYSRSEDVLYNPPARPCTLTKNFRDEFTGEIRKETQRLEWFRYTNPVMRNYLQGKTHILCEAALEMRGENAFLLLTFTMNDPAPKKSFGGLAKNSVASLRLVDGSAYVLYNLQADEGITDPETGQTTYRARYAVDKPLFRKMQNTESDKIRIAWMTGYEDYDIQQVDTLMRLSHCF